MKNKLLKITKSITAASLIILTMLLLSANKSYAQNYTNYGSYRVDSNYTISFSFKGNYDTDHKRSCNFWEMGNHSISLSYPNIIYITGNNRFTILLDGIAQKGYYYYKDTTRFITITCQYDYSKKEKRVYVDNHLIGTQKTNLPAIKSTLSLVTNPKTTADFDKFFGIIQNMTFTNRITEIVVIPNEKPRYNINDYPVGYVPGSQNYDSVRTAKEQLEYFRTPKYADTTEAIASCINMNYLAGGNNNISAEITANAVTLQRILTTKFNFEIRVSESLESYYSYKKYPYSITYGMIALAKEIPNATTSFGTAWAHNFSVNGIPIYNTAKLTPYSNLNVLDNDKEIFRIYTQSFKDALGGRVINRHCENNEYLSHYTSFGQPINSIAYAAQTNYVLEPIRQLFPGINSTEYDIHSSWFWSNKELLFSERIKISTTGLGTIQFYPRYPNNWRMWSAADRGIGFYLRSKYQEIADGHPLNTPFICFGWDKVEENNIRFAQALGLCKILKVAGSKYFYSAYFTLSNTGIQNPKGYVWQLVVPAYTEAATSQYKNIIEKGELLKGDVLINWYYGNGQPQFEYNFYTGDKSVFCVVRKLDNEYLIATTYQPLNNYVGQKNNKEATILLEGETLTFKSRRCGSLYYYNKLTKEWKQLDASHMNRHPDRWNIPNVKP